MFVLWDLPSGVAWRGGKREYRSVELGNCEKFVHFSRNTRGVLLLMAFDRVKKFTFTAPTASSNNIFFSLLHLSFEFKFLVLKNVIYVTWKSNVWVCGLYTKNATKVKWRLSWKCHCHLRIAGFFSPGKNKIFHNKLLRTSNIITGYTSIHTLVKWPTKGRYRQHRTCISGTYLNRIDPRTLA